MVKFHMILKQPLRGNIKFAHGSKQEILRELGKTLDGMPATDSITFEFVKEGKVTKPQAQRMMGYTE